MQNRGLTGEALEIARKRCLQCDQCFAVQCRFLRVNPPNPYYNVQLSVSQPMVLIVLYLKMENHILYSAFLIYRIEIVKRIGKQPSPEVCYVTRKGFAENERQEIDARTIVDYHRTALYHP